MPAVVATYTSMRRRPKRTLRSRRGCHYTHASPPPHICAQWGAKHWVFAPPETDIRPLRLSPRRPNTSTLPIAPTQHAVAPTPAGEEQSVDGGAARGQHRQPAERITVGRGQAIAPPSGLPDGVAWRSCVLMPGDALLLPARWWHWVHALPLPPHAPPDSPSELALSDAAVLSVNWWLDRATRAR